MKITLKTTSKTSISVYVMWHSGNNKLSLDSKTNAGITSTKSRPRWLRLLKIH